MTAAATTFIVGEKLSLVGWSGIVALVAGVFLLSARGGRELAKIDRRAVGFALITALTICTYSVVDGIGARLSANPNAYSLWLFVGIALVMLPYALLRDGRDVIPAMRIYWRRGFAGGALQVLSYGIAIWAMTVAPIAIVATLRETSVLFGAVIAVVVLKEPPRAVRIAAALLIVCGLVLIRLQ
jgi:drug/metabolite transporter (DMT)-like permease